MGRGGSIDSSGGGGGGVGEDKGNLTRQGKMDATEFWKGEKLAVVVVVVVVVVEEEMRYFSRVSFVLWEALEQHE
ncbi:hypothetical protein E2C01_071925 [Portunus trituberculatus]|uniref:Uncharacterized protein n=1 Tax=Portunus trituberculatus TaxID=210409 RepID=A0A5B7HWL4_PORTR|nr:hypothetical protein [Portunus trituberculatus]